MDLDKRLRILEYKLCLLEKGNDKCIDIVLHFSDIETSGNKRFILVINNEMDNGDSSLYLYTGLELQFLITLQK